MKKILSLILVAIMFVTAMPMAFAADNTYKVGDIIQFGSYPQSKVTDKALVAELNALAPEWEDWTSYGYYSGDGTVGSMVQGDWMRYTDIICNGKKYRGVKFILSRPYYTIYEAYSTSQHSSQHHYNYYTDSIYWFEFEFIDWRVLDPTTGLVMCETIIDSQPYSNTIYRKYDENNQYDEYYNDAACTNFASDYETSSIRKWLNNDFYNTAFSNSEKKEINTTTLNNDSIFTIAGVTGFERLDGKETKDKIFLLSINDIENENYGFISEVDGDHNKTLQAQGSDYAKSQGLSWGDGTTHYWILRSAGFHSHYSCDVDYKGYSYFFSDVFYSANGIRPALCFKDIANYKHQHACIAVFTPPTCITSGYSTYTCVCGYRYVGDYVAIVPHVDANSDRKCDNDDCNYEFKEPNFFQKIVQWFKDLFAKLFGWMKK